MRDTPTDFGVARPGRRPVAKLVFQEQIMQSKLVSICSQLAEVGVFVGAAAALAAGMLGLR